MTTEEKDMTQNLKEVCKHESFYPLGYECIQCKECKAIAYHRDSGGIGQPPELVWNNQKS